MNYAVNPLELNSFFAVPSSVCEKHLKLSSENQLKVLLLFLKNGGFEGLANVAQQKIGVDEKTLIECLDYWCQSGVLIDHDKELKQKKEREKEVKALITQKPTREETIKRASESAALQFMFNQTQNYMGRMITQAEMATLVWLHDNEGLPVEIILIAIQYCVDEGKKSFSYIEKLCLDWAKSDIFTLDKAQERINQLYLNKTAWKICESAFGIAHRKPSTNEEKYAAKWVNEFGFSKKMLSTAYNICVDNKSKLDLRYINGIIDKWYSQGIKTPEDLENLNNKVTPKKHINVQENEPSYDKAKILARFNNFDEE